MTLRKNPVEWWPRGSLSQVALIARTPLNHLSQILLRHATPRLKLAFRLEAATKCVLGPGGKVPLEAWLLNVMTSHPAFATMTEGQRTALREKQDRAEHNVHTIFKNLVATDLTPEEENKITNAAERLKHRIRKHKARHISQQDAIIDSLKENE